MTAFGRPSWLDRAVDEALAVCPTMQPWEVRVMLIAAAPTIQNAATEAAVAAMRADLSRDIEAAGRRRPFVDSKLNTTRHLAMLDAATIVRGEARP